MLLRLWRGLRGRRRRRRRHWSAPERREAAALGLELYDAPLPPARVAAAVQGCEAPQLAFEDAGAAAAFRADCEGQVAANCERGARAVCALKAARHCGGGPPWMRWLGLRRAMTGAEEDACRAEFADECVRGAAAACRGHAEAFCALAVDRSCVGDRPPAAH